MSKLTPFLAYVNHSRHLMSLQLNLTHRCYSKCLSCRQYEWPKHELTFDQVIEIISDASKHGCQTIVLTGGEPLAHKDICKIVDVITEYGFDVGVITSGIIHSKQRDEIIKTIVEKCKWIQVSIDSASQSKFKEIRGVDELNNVIETVEEINKIRSTNMIYKRPVKINTVLSKLNCTFDEIVNMMKLARYLGCELAFHPVHTWKDLMLDAVHWEIIKTVQSAKIIPAFLTNFYELKPEKDETPPICICSQIHAVVDADGYVYPCCRMLNDNGNYDEQRKFSLGHYSDGFSVLMKKSKQYYNAPTNLETKEICANCDRYVKFNREFYDFITESPKLFV